MSKKRVVVLVVILVFLMIIFRIFCKFVSVPQKSDNATDFLEGKYTYFAGGEEAEKFFDNYIDIKNYKNIAFKHRNYEKKLTLYKAYTIFCVDVEYTEQQYNQNFEKIFLETDCPDLENKYNYRGDYLITTIMIDGDVYENNYCGVFFNSHTNTIRYVFIYDIEREEAIVIKPYWLVDRSCPEVDWE